MYNICQAEKGIFKYSNNISIFSKYDIIILLTKFINEKNDKKVSLSNSYSPWNYLDSHWNIFAFRN